MTCSRLRWRTAAQGKQDDGTAKTREVKLGCVFSQTKTDEEGQPLRDYQSTSYVGTLQSVGSFAPLLRDEARRRGIGKSQKVVFIGDGAAWIWELARTHFPLAILILDFYHRMEYLHELSQLLYGKDTPWAGRMKDLWKEQMEQDEVQAVIDTMKKRAQQLGDSSADTLKKIQEKSDIWRTTRTRCATERLGDKGSSTDRESWKPGAAPSSVNVSNNPGCSGPNPALKISWPFVVP